MKKVAEMTAQEVFNEVKDHLLSQKEQSRSENGCCAYRGEDGLKCAIGCLLPDELCFPEFEGQSIFGIINYNEILEFLGDTHVSLLEELQSIHDDLMPVDWPDALLELARNRGLKF